MDKAALREEFHKRAIKRVKVGGFDIDGVLRGKYISTDKFWSSLDNGFGFCDVIFGWDVNDAMYDNAEVTGWHTGYPDALAKIDPESFRILPSEPTTAQLLVDFWRDATTPHAACPRNLLKSVAARARAAGYAPRFGVEYEYWIFRESPHSLREKGFRNLTPLSPGMCGYSWVREGQNADLNEDILAQMEGYGIPIESMHTETGPGVYETAIAHAEPLAAADMAALFKTTLKILCARHGCCVTFMAKWHPDLPGSSGHIHQSLGALETGENLFASDDGDHGLSELGQRYLAGLMALSPDLTAIFSPTINSYKRFVPGMWAPMSPSWDIENRTCSIRVINGPGKSATRLELRQTAADINPYLAIAASLAAGLYGIERGLSLGPPSRGDATRADVPRFPATLADATQAMAKSQLVRQVLPEAFVEHYVRTRDWEVRQHARSVSQWELERYFEAI